MKAPIPSYEKERLEALRGLEILDTPAEASLDRITRLVANVLDVPIALVSLIDEDRQWFKSREGLEATQTPREIAFCAHAILQSTPLVVPDAAEDERFRDNQLVTGAPHIRFYAGVPIRTSKGFAVGTLCAIDERPRELTKEELDTLRDLADIVSREVLLRENLMLARLQKNRSDALFKASEAGYRSMFELASVGIALVAPDGAWISVNSALCEILGYTPEELKDLTFQDITHPEDLNSDMELLTQLIDNKIDCYQMEKRYVRKDGRPVWVNLNVTKKLSEEGLLEYFISIIQNIQERKELEQEARHDALTGLFNRRALDAILPIAQARADRSEQQMALMFIDLDGFKGINDTYGHDAGDDLLRSVSARLQSSVRRTDSLIRLAGDEFIVILEGIVPGVNEAREVAKKLLAAIGEPIIIKDDVILTSASVGFSMYEPGSGKAPDELMREADRWMYKAKHSGKGRVMP
ncbi:sensor domain-containing diguanylate cyclase [Pseudomonas bohemica]|uniref:sensor domain-containing diguanylate cyclase n=1 Tax=Pseudomonas bohemica TaxID=2044872 RepID=UPI000DA5F44F|nr:sensor domain-containing diguanylate cyclase [Pseudomonas bohemica]